MSYKIAVATSDGINIDLTFGSAFEFTVYNIDGTDYHISEKRKFEDFEGNSDCNKSGCGNGGCGNGTGCSGGSDAKVRLISDCRCVVCKKIGFNIQKQLGKLAITAFDIDCGVDEALSKITAYLQKIDNHQSLRGIAKDNKI